MEPPRVFNVFDCAMIPMVASRCNTAPFVAGLAMALSSISVVSNSLLLNRFTPGKHSRLFGRRKSARKTV